MSIERYRNDNPRSAEEVAEAIEFELQQIDESLPVIEGTQNYAYVQSISTTLAEQQEESLNDLYDAAYIPDASDEELTKLADSYGVDRQDAVAATGVVEFSRATAASEDRTIPSGTRVTTGGDNAVTFITTEVAVIESGTTSDTANIRCQEAGPIGNVGTGTITSFIDKPAGVESVTNPQPVGARGYTLTDGQTQQTVGQEEEDDESLRERVLESVAIGGAGTAGALELALDNIDEVISADVFTNRTSSIVNGVDPWNTEIRVYGGEVETIGERVYEVLPITTLKSLQGGVNGNLDQTTINTGDLYGTLTIPITRPVQVDLDITVDLVHTAQYSGTTDVKNAIVNYVGGTTTDAREVTGLGQGDNIIVNELENVVEDVRGVEAVTSSLIDDNTDGTDDTTTDSDGVQVYEVSDSEVAVVDAANITVNETQR